MSTKAKKYLAATLVFMSMMFIWIFVTVFLTGGKEFSAFSNVDYMIFNIFIVVEIITLIMMFVFAVKTGKENQKNIPPLQSVPKTKYEKIMQRRGALLLVCSFLVALIIHILGIVTSKYFDASLNAYILWTLIISCLIPILLFPINIILSKVVIQKIEGKKIEELQQYIFSHRKFAEETAMSKLKTIKRIRKITDIYTVLFGIYGVGIAFCAGLLMFDSVVPFCFLSGLCFCASLSRVRYGTPRVFFEEDPSYVSKEEYPEIYTLAEKAAETLDCKGEIRISLLADFNAGIAQVGNIYSVQLGVILLNALSKDELYTVLLHEFSHVTKDNSAANKEMNYNVWLNNGGNPNFYSGLISLLFRFWDILYNVQYSLYNYASTILHETSADRSMVQYADAQTAASALLKIKYYYQFTWEKGTYDEECFYESEQPSADFIRKEVEGFKNALKLREKEWEKFVNVEILSRNASHPTLKMRFENLGISEFKVMEFYDSAEYKDECIKALQYVEELFHQEMVKTYEENRKNNYLEPKQLVEAWEAAGKPIIMEEYADIISALMQLSRNQEANELCEKAIEELSGPASCYAHYMRGCFLLHQYDASGIEHIYYAIENNTNYIDEGLNMVGEFCCMAGLQKELDVNREKAVELAQKEKDVYCQIGILSKKDQLSKENLPDGMLEEILKYIHSIDEGCIQNIYLVRKTITDDFHTSPFVIQFDEQTSEETQYKILHKIFAYLDTSSDWQFSLFNYTEVKDVKIENIEGSCVFSKVENR